VVKDCEVEERKCPECGCGDKRRSHMRGLWERGVLRTIGVRAYRCDACQHRYYEFQLGKAKDEKPEK
jgi:rubredoxin